jgi:hypothetical protein
MDLPHPQPGAMMNSNDQPPASLDFLPRRANDRAMLSRIINLEKEMVAVRTTVEVIRSNYVTKEDLARVEGILRSQLHQELDKQTWRFVGFVTVVSSALTAAVFFIARSVH